VQDAQTPAAKESVMPHAHHTAFFKRVENLITTKRSLTRSNRRSFADLTWIPRLMELETRDVAGTMLLATEVPQPAFHASAHAM
jgi:hypothetical protein